MADQTNDQKAQADAAAQAQADADAKAKADAAAKADAEAKAKADADAAKKVTTPTPAVVTPARLDETVPGGRYVINGVTVDANGKEVS